MSAFGLLKNILKSPPKGYEYSDIGWENESVIQWEEHINTHMKSLLKVGLHMYNLYTNIPILEHLYNFMQVQWHTPSWI